MSKHIDIFKNAVNNVPAEKLTLAVKDAIPHMSEHNIITSLLRQDELITETVELICNEPSEHGYDIDSFEFKLIRELCHKTGLPFKVQSALIESSQYELASRINDLPIALLDKIIEKCFGSHSSSVMYFLGNILGNIFKDATMNINLRVEQLKKIIEIYRSNDREISLDIITGWFKNPSIPLDDLLFLLDPTLPISKGDNKYASSPFLSKVYTDCLKAFLKRPGNKSIEELLSFFALHSEPQLAGSVSYLGPVFSSDNVSLETKIKLIDINDEGGLYPDHDRLKVAYSEKLSEYAINNHTQDNDTHTSINPVFLKKSGIFTLMEHGYPLSLFLDTCKSKQTLSLLIGSSHKEEISLYQRSPTLCLNAFSVLQNHFVNTTTGKQNRHGYIQFLTEVNKLNVDGSAFELNVNNFNLAVETIGYKGVLETLASQAPPAARDTLNFIAELVSCECEVQKERQQKLIQRWLSKNQDHDCFFHDYLKNKSSRDTKITHNPVFFQKRLEENVNAVTDFLDVNNRESDIEVCFELPTDGFELSRIGRAQRHCVGSKAYADACASGRAIIFSLYPKSKGLKHGFTFEFNRHSKALVQAEGFARATPNESFTTLAKRCFELLGQQ